jgi:hypothetical protein
MVLILENLKLASDMQKICRTKNRNMICCFSQARQMTSAAKSGNILKEQKIMNITCNYRINNRGQVIN